MVNSKELNNYILLDAARAQENFEKNFVLNSSGKSLYAGSSERSLSSVAPYVFTFPYLSEFSYFILQEGWGNAWGVIVETKASFEECYNHFRKFLLVKTEAGEQLYFRFYDPRVLKIFLPTCDKQQLIEFFGPTEKFIVEGEDKETAIVFELKNGVLQQSEVSTASVFGLTPEATTKKAVPGESRKKRNIIIDDEVANPKK